jgi:cell division septation protein DedD
MASEDTEITLGVGKLLGLFLLLAAICAIFFSIGFSLGKTSGHEQAVNDQPAAVAGAPDSGSSTSSDPKPSAAVATKSDTQSTAAPASNTADQQGSLTFYNAVKENDKAVQAAAESKAAAEQATGPKVVAATTPAAVPAVATPPNAATSRGSEVMSHTSPVTGPGTMVVQIAAVSREDDAVALAGALRKKNYNVFVVNNPVTNDKLYHVQVGPFSTLAEAEAMKAKLVAEGYNPIIKK